MKKTTFSACMGLAATLAVVTLLMGGCGSIMRKATEPVLDNLTASIMKQQDLALVRDGAPTFLLLIDGLVEGSPDDPKTLMTAAQLYSAYVSAFVLNEDPQRAKLMSSKARAYAFAAMSLKNETFAQLHDKPFEAFEAVLPTFFAGDEEILFLVISTWATFIQAHRGNWDNIADIAKVEALARKLLELDETYYYGSGHLLLGVLRTLLPASLGGKPEEARKHFDRAVQIADGKFLPAYVLYAQHYAKSTFNRELHDRLLETVRSTPADVVPELTLINTLAKQQADDLLNEADDYF